MTKRLRILFAISLFFLSALSYAGEDVAGTWTSLTIKKDFKYGLGLSLRGEYRTTDNISATDLYFIRLTGSYKPCPYFSVAFSYDYMGRPQGGPTIDGVDYQAFLRHHHRFIGDINGIYGSGDWTFSLRERYVFAYGQPVTTSSTTDEGVTTDLPFTTGHLLRTMPKIAYHIPDTRWTPYMSIEFYNSLKKGEHFAFSQYHLFAGVNWKINQVNAFNFCYVLQHRFPADKRIHTIDLEYIITIP